MQFMKRRFRFSWPITILLMLCLVMVPVISNAGGEKEEAASAPDKTLVIGIPELPPAIDCDTCSLIMTFEFLVAVEDMLLTYEEVPAPGYQNVRWSNYRKCVPELVESFEIAPDGKSISFHLRKGVMSAYGNEFTVDDMLWRYERGLALHGTTEFFAHVMDFYSMDAFEVIDDYNFVIHVERPNAVMGDCHTLMCLSPWDSTEAKKHATAEDSWAVDYINKNAPGFGPYYITEWAPGDKAILSRNPNYFQKGEPYYDKMIMKVVPETASRVAMLRDGTLDLALDLSPREIDSLKDASGVQILTLPGVWLTHLILNQDMVEPFKNKKVRQAVNYAIDRDRIVNMAYFGMAQPLKTCMPAHYPGAIDSSEFPYNYNIEKAKKLMAEAGYGDGFSVELYYQSGYEWYETACLIIKEDLAKIGIDVDLRQTPVGTLAAMVTADECPFGYWREGASVADPNYALSLWYMGKKLGGYLNHGHYNNEEVNELCTKAKPIVDPEDRIKFHLELQRVILEDAPVGYVVIADDMWAMADNLAITMGPGQYVEYAKLRPIGE